MQTSLAENVNEISDDENFNLEDGVSFDKYELKNFIQEIKLMVTEGKDIDISRAVHNARYLGKIDRATERMDAGHWIEHDIIEVEDDD